jgi:hypothetical protein
MFQFFPVISKDCYILIPFYEALFSSLQFRIVHNLDQELLAFPSKADIFSPIKEFVFHIRQFRSLTMLSLI